MATQHFLSNFLAYVFPPGAQLLYTEARFSEDLLKIAFVGLLLGLNS